MTKVSIENFIADVVVGKGSVKYGRCGKLQSKRLTNPPKSDFSLGGELQLKKRRLRL